jgi:hypothetical protein
MKIPLLTQAIKVFLAETMYSAKKAKEMLTKKQKAMNITKEVKRDLNKKLYPVTEDQKFKNVSE